MRFACCTVVFFTTSAWVWLLPLFGPSRIGLGLGSAGVAVLAAILMASAEHAEPARKWRTFVPTRGWLPGIGLLLDVVVAQSVVAGVCLIWFSAHHRVDFCIAPVYWLLRLLGYECTLQEGVLYVWNQQFSIPFSANAEKLALLPVAILATGFLCVGRWLAFPDRPRWWWAAGLGTVFCMMLARFLLLVTVFLEYEHVYRQHPHPIALFVDSWLLLAVLAATTWVVVRGAVPGGHQSQQSPCEGHPPPDGKRWMLTFAAAGAGAALVAGGWLLQDPGTPKNGRILIDDFHSGRWEKSTVRMGKYDFGGEPVYSYSSLVYWLEHYLPEITVNETSSLDQLDLDQFAMVVLKTPASRYTDDEIEAVVRYVEEGGGLFLIGDHSNLLGMTTFLNTIAQRFGFSFNYDSSNQFSSSFFSEYSARFPWAHPTTMGLSYLSLLTSCTLTPPLFCERSMLAFNVFSDPIDYSRPSFFGDIVVKPDSNFGTFCLGAARKVGKGRVLLFTDSTIYSNFCLFVDGHDRHFLNAVNYLNRANRWGYSLNWAMAVFGGACLVWSVLRESRRPGRRRGPSPLSSGLAVGAALGCLTWGGINHLSYRLPEPKQSLTKVAFLDRHCSYFLPPGLGTPVVPSDVSFDTFFVATQRLGLFPFRARDTRQAVSDAKAIVIINPVEDFEEKEKSLLRRFVEEGGSLLILDTVYNRQPHLGDLADVFGFRVTRRTEHIEFDGGTQREFDLGGEERNFKLTVMTNRRTVGKGTVVLAADARVFSRASLGDVLAPEDDVRRKVYDAVYAILEELMHLAPVRDYPLAADPP